MFFKLQQFNRNKNYKINLRIDKTELISKAI